MQGPFRQSDTGVIITNMVLDADGAPVTGLGIAAFQISKNGAAAAAFNTSTISEIESGVYAITANATDMNTVPRATVTLADSSVNGMNPVHIWIQTQSIYDNQSASGAEAITEADIETAVVAGNTTYTTPTLAQTQAAVSDGLSAINLDHLLGAVDTDWATTVHTDSALGLMASKDSGNTFARATDSLEAITDNAPTAVWASAARTLTAIDEDSTTLDLDATIRAAVGMASANFDTQISTIDDFLDTEIAAIKAKTDNLPASPAAVGSSMTLTSDERNSVADALLDRSNGVETGVTPRAYMRASGAAMAGKLSGAGTSTEVFVGMDGSTTRITATVDASGNRTAIAYG